MINFEKERPEKLLRTYYKPWVLYLYGPGDTHVSVDSGCEFTNLEKEQSWPILSAIMIASRVLNAVCEDKKMRLVSSLVTENQFELNCVYYLEKIE